MNLLEQRILIVTGKGGVGKTTLCATLGLTAASLGARSIIVETAGGRRIAPIFGKRSRGYEIMELIPDLFTLSVTPKEAIEDYIVQQLHFRRLYKMVFENRVMAPFIDAVPGLHDAVQLGKVWDLERQEENGKPYWDLIIVDAPATGHGLTLLDSPSAMSELTRAGPMHRAVKQVKDLVEDAERTALVLVSLPETIPVSETLDLHRALGPRLQAQVKAVVLNEFWGERASSSAEVDELTQSTVPQTREAAELLKQWIRRCKDQVLVRDQILKELDLPVLTMPFLVDRQLFTPQITQLARSLRPLFTTDGVDAR
jgi:anion-transporting  ArsA/GET3 family ATPase